MNRLRRVLGWIAGAVLAPATPVWAADGVEAWAEAEVRAVESERAVVDGDAIEASGVGAALDGGFTWTRGRTEVQFDLGAAVFDFADNQRATRTSLRTVATLSREVAPALTIALQAGHWEDITTLEARETDQDAIALEAAFEKGPHRARAGAQYRARQYAAAVPSRGDGMRFDADYTYRLGAWHWLRVDLAAENIDSADSLRGYERQTVRTSYSVPLDQAKRWRLRPQLEWRAWTYDQRLVSGTASKLRRERYIAPEIGLAYGKLHGLKARLRAAYQFRQSNDPRYRGDAPYVDLTVGYRF